MNNWEPQNPTESTWLGWQILFVTVLFLNNLIKTLNTLRNMYTYDEGNSQKCSIITRTWKGNLESISPFYEFLIPLFWNSGDNCSGFKVRRISSIACLGTCLHKLDSSDWTPVRHLLTIWHLIVFHSKSL